MRVLLGVVLAVALALAGCAASPAPSTTITTPGASTTTSTPAKQVHYHAKYQVWVNGTQLDFSDPRFNDRSVDNGGRLYLPAHLHVPSDVVHNEAREGAGEGTMSTFFHFTLGGKLANDEIVVPAGVRGVPTGTYHEDAGGRTVRMFVSHANATPWARVPDIPAYAFQDGDRILVIFGSESDAQVEQREAAFPPFDPRSIR